MSNINGYCPHCNADLDGDLVINYPLRLGKSVDEALHYASTYRGWDEYGIKNRWNRSRGIYDANLDRTTENECPDCNKRWKV